MLENVDSFVKCFLLLGLPWAEGTDAPSRVTCPDGVDRGVMGLQCLLERL